MIGQDVVIKLLGLDHPTKALIWPAVLSTSFKKTALVKQDTYELQEGVLRQLYLHSVWQNIFLKSNTQPCEIAQSL